jgi:hypothetical protein
MRWLIASGCALLSASCAGSPSVVQSSVAGGIARDAKTFAIAPAETDAARAAVPLVARRLESYGFRKAAAPDLLVTVAVTERPRNVGAFTSASCPSSAWSAPPRKPWLIGGGRVETLSVSMSNAKTGALVYRSSASLRTSSPDLTANLVPLVSSALGSDPRRAEPNPAAC